MSTRPGTGQGPHDKTHGADEHLVRLARVALALLVEPGNRELYQLIHAGGPSVALRTVLDGRVSSALGGAVATRLSAMHLAASPDAALGLAEQAVGRASRLGARIVAPEDDEWPWCLDDLARIGRPDGPAIDREVAPPVCLWVRGDASLRDAMLQAVAVVGARAATDYGLHVAGELAYGLAERDWCVVSGGAFGIDAAAHRGALAAGGLTIAVLACGIDRPYPLAHSSLFERVAEEGLLISEWPPGSSPHRQHFLIRNRVLAAGTRGTVMVEAASRSGARQTLGRARWLGRAAMAVPGPITSAMSVGANAELRTIGTRLVTSVEEILEEVGPIGDLAAVPRGDDRPLDALDPLAARLFDAVLPRRARTPEEIAAAAGVSTRDARRGLPLLVMAGLVVFSGLGYRLAPGQQRRSQDVDAVRSP